MDSTSVGELQPITFTQPAIDMDGPNEIVEAAEPMEVDSITRKGKRKAED